ncbi:TPA: preprotein translocase subunit Sec61beta [Candidatus Bathyarchaeota archaeon]|nr:preprotein translocase subunit Sec61beta [Candidatus Bathyarchaeota archaeon]
MSREKRRKRGAPPPMASAGILSFFSEESFGLKIRPEVVIALTAGLILSSVLILWLLAP